MSHQVLVGNLERRADLLKELQAAAQGQRVAGPVDGLAFDVLHDEEGQLVVGTAAVKDAGDAGMFEAGEDLPLGVEAAEDREIGLAGAE